MATAKTLVRVVSDSLARVATNAVTDDVTWDMTDAVTDAVTTVHYEDNDADKFQFTFVDGCQVHVIVLTSLFIVLCFGMWSCVAGCRVLFSMTAIFKNIDIRNCFA